MSFYKKNSIFGTFRDPWVVVDHQQQQVRPDHGDQALNHLSAQLRSVLDFSRLPTLEEALSPSGMTSPARQR